MFLKEHEGIGQISENSNYQDGRYWDALEKMMIDLTNNAECFASCFSTGGNKLSQWERYADMCKGFSIGFSEEKEFRIALVFSKDNKDLLYSNLNEYIADYSVGGERDFFDLKLPQGIIEEVYMGPLNQEPEEEISRFLEDKGISCKIRKSTIPYSPLEKKKRSSL